MPISGNYSETAAARSQRRLTPEPPFAGAAPPPARAERVPVGAAAAPARAGRKDSGSPEEKEAARRRKRVAGLESRIALLEKEVEAIEMRLYEEALTLGPVASTQLAGQRREKKEEIERLVDEWASLAGQDGGAGRRGGGATA